MSNVACSRSSHQRCSRKIAVLKNFATFTGKHLQACNFIKKRLQHRCFPVNIAKFLRRPILKNIYNNGCSCLYVLALLCTFLHRKYKKACSSDFQITKTVNKDIDRQSWSRNSIFIKAL